ncbi:MAG: MCE family protein [Ignavibacteria bacterium]|nr:MlaD family protein [Ignavibacteria bacterium]MCC7157997.1 MCE family protein [Ignavibacteria bacterium]
MDKDKKTLVKVGFTVLVSIIILLWGVAFLKDLKFGLETNDLTVYFQDVNGLKEGDPVSVNGVVKGKINTIELAQGDSVKVDFSLSKDVVLKKDYEVSVAMIELMSGKQIYVKPGVSKDTADVTRPLVGARTNDIVGLIGTMNDIGEDVKHITRKLDTAMTKMSVTVDHVNDIVGDDGLKSNIKGAASNFNLASRNLNFMLADTRSSINSLTAKLNNIATNIDNTVTDTKPELKETMQDVRILTGRLDSLTINLNSLVLNASDSNSTVGKLLGEDDMYENINKALLSINKLVKKIEKDGIRLKLF